jgi:hypothetical protein
LSPGTFDLEDMENNTVIPGSWRLETKDKDGFLNLQNVP